MRKYIIPPTIKENEKVIGGILSMGEFLYLIMGLVVGICMFVLFYKVSKVLGIMMGVLFSLSGVPFAFVKIRGYSLVKYYKYKKNFNKKEKKLPNKRFI